MTAMWKGEKGSLSKHFPPDSDRWGMENCISRRSKKVGKFQKENIFLPSKQLSIPLE